MVIRINIAIWVIRLKFIGRTVWVARVARVTKVTTVVGVLLL